MKNVWNTPKLEIYGSVEELTTQVVPVPGQPGKGFGPGDGFTTVTIVTGVNPITTITVPAPTNSI